MTKSLSDLAAKIVSDIDEGFAAEDRGEARSYIGASMAGTDCTAKMQLSLRGFPEDPIPPRVKRIFRAGHGIENMVVKDLKQKADLLVYEKDEWTGKQFRYEWLGGHVVCNTDGMVDFEDGSPRAILEIKSMNDANFKKFSRHGVKVSHRHYYRQMTMMMAMSGIKRSFFISYCKNTSQYHAEIVEYDEEEWLGMFSLIQAALDGRADRIANTDNDYRCKGCFKRSACWSVPKVDPKCRFCENASPSKDGDWLCDLDGSKAVTPCDKFKLLRPT